MHDFVRQGKASTRTKSFPQFLVLRKAIYICISILFSLFVSVLLIGTLLNAVSTWKRDRPLGIAILTGEKNQIRKSTTIVWVNPIVGEVSFLNLPNELYVHTPQANGYTLSALYGLYAIEHRRPQDFLTALTRNLKIDITALAVREDSIVPSAQTTRQFALQLIFDTQGTYSLRWVERVSLATYLLFTNYKPTTILVSSALAASQTTLDDVSYDKFIQKNYINTLLKKEALSVAVVNASKQTKLASTVGRVFLVLGLNVLSVSDTPNTVEQGSIVVTRGSLMQTATIDLLARHMQVPIRVDPQVTAEYRADVVLFLSKNEAQNFSP